MYYMLEKIYESISHSLKSNSREKGPRVYCRLLDKVIGGDKDKVIPNYLQEILQTRLRNSKLYIVKNGSHVPQVDFPKNINERINLFIQSLIST